MTILSSIKKLLKNDFFKGTSTYLFTNAINAVIPISLLPVMTRYLNPDEYGEVSIFQAVLGALGAFIGLNAANAASRKFYDNQNSTSKNCDFVTSCIHITLLSAVVVFLLAVAFLDNIISLLSLDSKWIFAAIIVSTATTITNLRLSQWQIRKEARSYGLLQISQSGANMALSLVLVTLLLNGAAGRIEAQIYISIIFCAISVILLFRDGLLKPLSYQPKLIKEALHFGVPLLPHTLGIFLMSSIDRVVIKNELGLSETGLYTVAIQFSLAFALIFDAINKAYVPWLFERLNENNEAVKIKIVRYTYTWYTIIVIGVITTFYIGPWVVLKVAGESYADAGEIIGWLALGQGFNGMYLMVTNYIFYSKRTGLLSFTTVGCGLLNFALLILLTKTIGLKGAAIAFSVSMLIRFTLTWWLAHRCHPMPWFKLQHMQNIKQC